MAKRKFERTSLRILPWMPEFPKLFQAAADKWPGIKLGYTGTGIKTGNHYFQLLGHPEPFILTEHEFAAYTERAACKGSV